MDSHHLFADLSGCPAAAPTMTDPDALQAVCLNAVTAAGLTPVVDLFHRFDAVPTSPDLATHPVGITGGVLLAESHLAVHTWPEIGAVTLDVHVCNLGNDNRQRAQHLLESLCAAFLPVHVGRQAMRRCLTNSGQRQQ